MGCRKWGGGAGRAQGGGDLLGDEAALADAGEHEGMAGCKGSGELADSGGEDFAHGAVEADGELFESGGFGADDLCGRGESGCALV